MSESADGQVPEPVDLPRHRRIIENRRADRAMRLREDARSREDNRYILGSIDMSERRLVLIIAAFVPGFALIGVVAAMSQEGPHTPTRMLIAILVMATTVPVGLLVRRLQLGAAWLERIGGRVGPGFVFVMYADLGVAATLFTFVDHEAALFGTMLLAITSSFVADFGTRIEIVWHVSITSVLIVVLAVMAFRQGSHDLPGIIARAVVALLVVNGTIGSKRLVSMGIQSSLRAHFGHANRDSLTGLLNRRGFEHWATLMLAETSSEAGFLLLDADNFKQVNDKFGHDVGDGVLRLLAERIEEAVGFTTATVARIGGEEFAIAAALDASCLTDLAESIRRSAYDEADAVPITVSIGVATGASAYRVQPDRVLSEQETVTRGLAVADTAMYAAKASGRDCVVSLDFAHIPAQSKSRPDPRVRDLHADIDDGRLVE